MPYEILRTPQVAAALRRMSAREKRSYDAARDALRSEGCKAGGYRLAAADGDDYPLCCRHLAYATECSCASSLRSRRRYSSMRKARRRGSGSSANAAIPRSAHPRAASSSPCSRHSSAI